LQYRSKEIGFKANKTPEELFKDINKRLITTKFCIDQWNILNLSNQNQIEYKKSQNEMKEMIESIRLDLRHNDSNEEFTLYLEKGYGKIKYYPDSTSLTLTSLKPDLAIKILKLIEKE
jgi:hypothetical protein